MIPALVLFIVLASIYGLTYVLNAKTPVPEGCEDAKHDCTGCQIVNCAHRKEKN